MKEIAFYLGVGALLTHELDAMTNHEWRVLPLVRALPDDIGTVVFVALHVPIFAGLIALLASSNQQTRSLSRLGIGAFLVVHGFLHALLTGHPAYEFSSLMSRILIFGGAALGGAYLVLEGADRRAGR
ncbi:MAG: DUF6713 family protein [Candidatus Binatia bacterium]